MKIVCTSDTHFKGFDPLIPDGDVFIHAGDFMSRGTPDEWDAILPVFAALPHKVKLLIAGNHDMHLDVYRGSALQDLRSVGVTVLGFPTKKSVYTLPNGMTILGLPGVTNLDNWPFNRTEKFYKELLANEGRHDIVVSHSPPYNTLDNWYGVSAYQEYMYKTKPAYWVCGHIHERYGIQQFDQTIVMNVAMCDRRYVLMNPPQIINI